MDHIKAIQAMSHHLVDCLRMAEELDAKGR
jgi:hypothetical protein